MENQKEAEAESAPGRQKRIIARLMSAVHNAQEELDGVAAYNAYRERFDASDAAEVQRLREWSVPYPTQLLATPKLLGDHCLYCEQPWLLNNAPQVEQQQELIREAMKPVKSARERVERLEKGLAVAQRMEEEDVDKTFDYRSRIDEFARRLEKAKMTFEEANAAAQEPVSLAQQEIHRLRREALLHRQKHWPCRAFFHRHLLADPETYDGHFVCMACVDTTYPEYSHYVKETYEVPEDVQEKWFIGTAA